MKREGLENLIREFEKTCGKDEARDSASAALFISKNFNYQRSDELKLNFLKQLNKEEHGTRTNRYFLVPLILAILLIFGFVYKVEASKPGDMLHPVKEFSILIQDNIKKAANPYENTSDNTITTKPSITESPKKNDKKSQDPSKKTINTNGTSQRVVPTVENGKATEVRGDLEEQVKQTKEAVEELVEGVINTQAPRVPQFPPTL